MDERLLSAIRDGKPWLERFTIKGYSAAFQAYMDAYGEAYRKAIRETGDAALAETLLSALEDGWRRTLFWNRSVRRFDEKQTIVAYLSPMLLELGEETFARRLQEAWARRWPKDAYQVAPYRKLQKGFRNAMMGIEVSPRRVEEDE